ncbi:unnamed protein product [Amoebophrya sp. A25]|nr:unnamed protein product [Amoebophrya sp. A25]|eukprot:GSA25T00021527001.1
MDAASNGYRVYRSGQNIIYAGKMCKEGAAEFQKHAYEAVAEREKEAKKPTAASASLTKKAPAAAATSANEKSGPAAPASPKAGGPPTTSGTGTSVAEKTASSVKKTDNGVATSVSNDASMSGGGRGGYVHVDGGATVSEGLPSKAPCTAQEACSPPVPASAAPPDTGTAPSCEAQIIKAAALDPKKRRPPLRFHFSSQGGDLAAGFAMMDTIREIDASGHGTECISKGFVGSAATFPAFACKKRIASSSCLFLLHPPSKSGVHGQTEEMRIHADNLDLYHKTSVAAYTKLTSIPSALTRIVQTFANNRYSTADEMTSMGLLDQVIP